MMVKLVHAAIVIAVPGAIHIILAPSPLKKACIPSSLAILTMPFMREVYGLLSLPVWTWIRVFTTSRGQVTPAATAPATNPHAF